MIPGKCVKLAQSCTRTPPVSVSNRVVPTRDGLWAIGAGVVLVPQIAPLRQLFETCGCSPGRRVAVVSHTSDDPPAPAQGASISRTGSASKVLWRRIVLTKARPEPPPTPIPSAVDPHTVEQARCRASRWSAQLDERPGRPVPCLLGLPGSTAGGMGVPTATTHRPAPVYGPPPILVLVVPPPEASS